MASAAEMTKRLDEVNATNAKLAGAIDKLADATTKSADESRKGFLGGAPSVRKGEDPFTSRGYSYGKVVQLMANRIKPEDASVEHDISNKLHHLYVEKFGYQREMPNSILVPMSSELLCQSCPEDARLSKEIGEVVRCGITGWDPDEVRQLAGRYNKTLSWNDATAMGSFVAPPMQGELIDLLRNNEVFLQAGAKMMAMPPNGRIVYPKQLGPSAAYWVGENTEITESEPTTGDLSLSAKKLGALCTIPNELFRFSSVSVEMFLRDDIAKVMGLKLDSALLQGVGSTNSPKGLIYYTGIGTHTATTVANDGNTFQPEDVALMIGKVEEANAVFNTFVMRPLMYTALVNRRADAVSAADGKGPFVFQYLRGLDENFPLAKGKPANLYGYPCLKSTNISNTRTKGSGTALTYILGGDFSDYVVGMSAVMEFALNTQGYPHFKQDQTQVRGIMLADGGPRREASFIIADQLVIG